MLWSIYWVNGTGVMSKKSKNHPKNAFMSVGPSVCHKSRVHGSTSQRTRLVSNDAQFSYAQNLYESSSAVFPSRMSFPGKTAFYCWSYRLMRTVDENGGTRFISIQPGLP